MNALVILGDRGSTSPPPVQAKWPTPAELLNVYGDFGCVRDSRGHSQFSPFFLTYLDAKDPMAQEWANNWLHPSRKYRHILLSPKYGYPGSPIDGWDFTPERFTELMVETLDLGLIPMVMLTDYYYEMPKALEVVRLLKERGLLPYIWLCVGWEIVGNGGVYTSREAYDANWALENACAGVEHYIFGHLQPGRASYASNPVQMDDPWRIWIWDRVYDSEGKLVGYKESECGNDAEVKKAQYPDGEYATIERQCFHDMPFMRMFFYQTEHEGWYDTPMLWEDRFRDCIPRFCHGMNGWRQMQFVFGETILYNDYRDEFGPNGEPFARQVATRARDIAAEYDAVIGYGNGAPTVTRAVSSTMSRKRVDGQLAFWS